VSALDDNNNRLYVNGNNNEDNNRAFSFGIALIRCLSKTKMKTQKNLYPKIYNLSNLMIAWRKARKGKTKKIYVMEFEKDTLSNLIKLQKELKYQTYIPNPLKTFILRDPKTRKISKSAFRDRIVHHAIHNVLEPIFEKTFIYDSCANRRGKGNLFAIKRFYKFIKKVSKNGKQSGWYNQNQVKGYCLKADVKHYFEEVNHSVLLDLIKKKINDKKIINLIQKILSNHTGKILGKGMPLGNLTSQFFANVYLNELDYFVKHKLIQKYYIRYVDDFIILNSSKEKLFQIKKEIDNFLSEKLRLQLHPEKTKIISLSKNIDFVGFRNFYYYTLLRKRNIKKMLNKIKRYKKEEIPKTKILESFQGWQAYAKWANTLNLRKRIVKSIYSQTQFK
jgi:RNA-directed DNA polymerase